jgi:hypothetical protein
MYAFDLLMANRSRSESTIRYRNDLSNVVLVGHARSFDRQRQLPRGLNIEELMFPAALVDAMSTLDEAVLESKLGQWLDRREIRALIARRDALIEIGEPRGDRITQ